MAWFRKSAPAEPLAVTMTGVKLGDRLLVVGTHDPRLTAALASKAGLTGQAHVAAPDQEPLDRARAIVEREGALAEFARAPLASLPYDADAFDVAVLPSVLPALTPEERVACLREVRRVLRPGGRIVVIDTAPRAGLGALISRRQADPHYAEHGPIRTLQAEGFAAVRTLAERDGYRFVEGAKR
ncbi:MAG TPA: class I SAM-dependent methyltransferase [Vicinamibacterales bacterium]|nr:class I SAM-dependent methyltransferase [Vicinamibacterales bacterium]